MLTYRYDAKLDGVWTSLESDMVREDGASAGRGIRGNRPTDIVASIGEAIFALDNTDQNEGETEGWYTLDHPDARAFWDFGTPIRFVLVWNGVDYVRWTGVLSNVLPDPFVSGLRAHVVVTDIVDAISSQEVRSVPPQHDKTEVELLDAAFDSLTAEAQPVSRDFDAAVSQFTYAFHDLGSGRNALGVVQDILQSAQGYGWPNADGSWHYENKTSRVLRPSQFHFTDLIENIEVPSSMENVFNLFRLTTHPKNDPDDLIVIWRNDGLLTLEPGDSQEIWATYRNPDNDEQLIGAFYVEPLDPGVDFEGNAVADGSGADLTTDLDITMSGFASTAKLIIENTGASTVYLPAGTLQIRGKAIYDRSPITREGYTAKSFAPRVLPIDLPYRDDDAQVKADADYLSANYSDRKGQATNLEFIANMSDEFEELACTLEIGDAITVTEAKSGLNEKGFFVQAIDWIADASGLLRVILGLAPRIVEEEATDDTVYVHDRLYAVIAAPESRIGFMRIGFSEVG